MKNYWYHIDRAWIESDEHSGCGWGYLRRFTPGVMRTAREHMDEALLSCRTIMEYRRVRLADESLKLFELFMKMRHDLAEGRFYTLAGDATSWQSAASYLMEHYKPQYCFGSPTTYNYFKYFYLETYEDATRIKRHFTMMTRPVREWRYMPDKDAEGERLGWTKAKFDDTAWKTTDSAVETWSSIGQHNYMGHMWYRTSVRLAAAPKGKKIYLWIAATDGSAKLFVNGQHVPYVNDKGESRPEFSGYAKPASFDISAAASAGENRFSILCNRVFLNELGTGGLMGPVMVYRER
jgi:hypothetical protein